VKLVYSERAVSDLARLRDFISKHNPSAATRIAAELVAKVEHLRRFPLIGRLVEESPEPQQIRDLVVSDYLVRYLPTENAIIVLRIWHHREHRAPEEELRGRATR